MFAQLINTLKKSPKTIVFTEGTDPRILEASARLLSGNFCLLYTSPSPRD